MAEAVRNRHRLLIVDDDPLVIRAMCKVLEHAGFDCIGVNDGADALSKVATGIDAAIVDIHLPDINGLELSKKLREVMGPQPPILILSGDVSMETIRALPDAGATYFFAKPVNSGQLIRQLQEWLGAERG